MSSRYPEARLPVGHAILPVDPVSGLSAIGLVDPLWLKRNSGVPPGGHADYWRGA